MAERSSFDDLEYEPFPEGERAEAFTGVAKMLDEHFPWGQWFGWYPGNFIPGERVAGWAQFVEDESGRLVLGGLLMLADNGVTADLLRKVPVAALENSANLTNLEPGRRDELRSELTQQWKAELGKMPAEALKTLEELPPLRREDHTPEEFSQLVADHFKIWAKYVPHPAAAMAADWKVKPATVHTWIREARLRGYLPPAKRGKRPVPRPGTVTGKTNIPSAEGQDGKDGQ